MASVLVTGWAEAGEMDDPGLGFIKHKKPKATEDYYIVKARSGKCHLKVLVARHGVCCPRLGACHP